MSTTTLLYLSESLRATHQLTLVSEMTREKRSFSSPLLYLDLFVPLALPITNPNRRGFKPDCSSHFALRPFLVAVLQGFQGYLHSSSLHRL